MSRSNTLIHAEIDLDADGKHQGFLRLPHSVHRSAYGWLPVPAVSVKNGTGPVVLLMAGNHGDEYEGQVALCNLIRRIDPSQIHGQVILLPMANFPAARAGRRTSPIDGGNLNRSFPGDSRGNPTQMIAHFIEEELLPGCDFLLDIHSGGSSLLYLPCAMMVRDPDEAAHIVNMTLLHSLAFPRLLIYQETETDSFSSSAARRKGAVAITTEVAGGGTIDRTALGILEKGLPGFLSHIGVLTSGEAVSPGNQGTVLEIGGEDYYCYADTRGLLEPLVEIGDAVTRGQPAARIHDPETPWSEPSTVCFGHDGLVICKRIPARVERGDCLFHLATPE